MPLVGSSPTASALKNMGSWSNRTTPARTLEIRVRLPVTPLEKHGPVVQRQRLLVHTQETMVQLHPGPLRLGRQPADHLGLEPGMLWVRLPPEPLRTITNDQWPRGAAWSARLPVTQEIAGSNPVEVAWKMARYANRQSGEAQTFVTAGSTPACATRTTCDGWASASPTGRNPAIP